MGRHSTYSQEIADLICARISEGESLLQICREDQFPRRETIHKWLNDNKDFANKYARARDNQADHYSEQIIEIADTEPDAAKARNRIDARKWYASKVAPKRYGDRLALDHDGKIEVAVRRFTAPKRPAGSAD